MAKNRLVNTHFWDDSYITELDPIEKLIFLYLLTNPLTNIAGIFEIKIRKIAFDTGIDKDMIQKIFDRFQKDNKIIYKDGYLIMVNNYKNQVLNPSVKEGIQRVINNLPNDIKNIVLDREGTDSPQTVLPNLTLPNLTKPNHTKPPPARTDGFLKNEDQEQNQKTDQNPTPPQPSPLDKGREPVSKSKGKNFEYDPEFEKKFAGFWRLYPRKDGNDSVVKKLLYEQQPEWSKLYEAVRNYSYECENRDIKYIKFPVSFVGKEKWRDYLG